MTTSSQKELRRKRRWNRENAMVVRAGNRRYYRENHAQQLARLAAYRAAHSAKARAAVTRYREKHPNYQREWRARRRLSDAWRKFIQTCAESRRALEAA
jgi:hypothetical protein